MGADNPIQKMVLSARLFDHLCRSHAENERQDGDQDKPELGRVDHGHVKDGDQGEFYGVEYGVKKQEEQACEKLSLFPLDRKGKRHACHDHADIFKEEDNQIQHSRSHDNYLSG